ncbi:AP-2 complex subunit sigma [Beauveria bassiana ARSEF 2860]|uniref:AP-2 complex subunit sigma n=4 Tax=Beauveria TaxID=5581 RepID=J4KQN4_BEAB2|nr:AP-2 complex subunit sigma [Beauveria bassiana ARSEF 2860]EJP69509.1 AP-2 complex subunit sigma [Beauveria bassiana ARSEF 2860]
MQRLCSLVFRQLPRLQSFNKQPWLQRTASQRQDPTKIRGDTRPRIARPPPPATRPSTSVHLSRADIISRANLVASSPPLSHRPLPTQSAIRLSNPLTGAPLFRVGAGLPTTPPPLTKASHSTMLSYILIQNRQGKTRLAKWYAPFSDEEKIKVKGEVHRLVAPRDQKYQSNFVEFRNHKIVYRRYAGLFFCVCVDTNDNELAYLEAIHFFVEVLDAFFGNVSELDLVFNFYKVYAILDEVFLAGEIEETSKQAVLTRLEHLDKLE